MPLLLLLRPLLPLLLLPTTMVALLLLLLLLLLMLLLLLLLLLLLICALRSGNPWRSHRCCALSHRCCAPLAACWRAPNAGCRHYTAILRNGSGKVRRTQSAVPAAVGGPGGS